MEMTKCPCRETVLVNVHIDSDLSCDGREKWKLAKIDKCIAPIVDALQRGGINMRGSCCGHEKEPGQIDLSDGRMIRIYPEQSWEKEEKKNGT